jgi:hypothetical protein
MAAATGAELFDRELFRLPLLVLAGGVVAPLASVTLKADQISHFSSPADAAQGGARKTQSPRRESNP